MSLLSLPVSCHIKKYRLLCWKIPNILCKVLWAYNFKRYWTLKVYFRLIFFSLLLDKYSSATLGTFYLLILRNTTSKCMHEAMISCPVKYLNLLQTTAGFPAVLRHWSASRWHLLALPQAVCMAWLSMLSTFASPGTEAQVVENSAFPLISTETNIHFKSKRCMFDSIYRVTLHAIYPRGS